MRELSFTLSHLTLRGLGLGDPQKPMILALHGWLDNAASFIPVSQYLTDYYIVAIDITGHGLSDHRAKGSHYHQIDFVHDIHELVESQDWPPFILMGHSMGGIIASYYASCFPEKVRQLISIESFGPMSKEPSSSPAQLRESIESRLKANSSAAKHPTSLESTIEARSKAGDMSEASATLLVNRNIEARDGQYFFKTDRRLRTISSTRITESQAEAFMRSIACPMLVILGDKGYESMKKALSNRKSWVANSHIIECEGHHHLHMDDPISVSNYINGFLLGKIA